MYSSFNIQIQYDQMVMSSRNVKAAAPGSNPQNVDDSIYQVEHTLTEKRVLQSTNHPFLIVSLNMRSISMTELFPNFVPNLHIYI